MGYGNLLSGPNSNHRLETTVYRPLDFSSVTREDLSVATPAEPRGEKKLFFVQILGGENLLSFGEKCR